MKKILLLVVILVFSLTACDILGNPAEMQADPTPVPHSDEMDDDAEMEEDADDDMEDSMDDDLEAEMEEEADDMDSDKDSHEDGDMDEDMKDDDMDSDKEGHDDDMDKDDDMMKPEVKQDLEASDPSQFMIASGEYQFVEFFAYWCPTCVNMAPVVHQLEADFHGDVEFTYLDIDDPATNDFKTQLGYLYQPHYFLLSPDGEVLGQWTGYVEQDTLTDVLTMLP